MTFVIHLEYKSSFCVLKKFEHQTTSSSLCPSQNPGVQRNRTPHLVGSFHCVEDYRKSPKPTSLESPRGGSKDIWSPTQWHIPEISKLRRST